MNDSSKREFTLPTEQETRALAYKVAAAIAPGSMIGLRGGLGVGKTTFTRYFAEALGATTPVSSPTFVLAHEHELPSGARLVHWDLYRLGTAPEELLERDAHEITVVEWIDRDPALALECTLTLSFELRDGERVVTIYTLNLPKFS